MLEFKAQFFTRSSVKKLCNRQADISHGHDRSSELITKLYSDKNVKYLFGGFLAFTSWGIIFSFNFRISRSKSILYAPLIKDQVDILKASRWGPLRHETFSEDQQWKRHKESGPQPGPQPISFSMINWKHGHLASHRQNGLASTWQ